MVTEVEVRSIGEVTVPMVCSALGVFPSLIAIDKAPMDLPPFALSFDISATRSVSSRPTMSSRVSAEKVMKSQAMIVVSKSYNLRYIQVLSLLILVNFPQVFPERYCNS